MTPIPTNPPPLDTIVYSRDGRRAKYVCSIMGKYSPEHYVRPEVEFGLPDGEVESSFEGAAVWHEYFLSPPRDVIDKEIATLQAKADELRTECIKLGREHAETKREIEKDLEARKARLARHEQLKQLDDFVTKGVACYVTCDHYGEINTKGFNSTKSDYGRDSFRLLSLFGDSKGQLNWQLNRYSDGSGDYTECIPCVSNEDAKAAVVELLNRRWDQWRKDGRLSYLSGYAKSSQEYGIAVPEDVAAQITKDAEQRKKASLEAAEKAFVDAQANLIKARDGIASSVAVPVPCGKAK